ncbi:MAG: uracil-DNA glycosylase [Bacteroidia bacterium]|jgi:uracil-DNA glycosylase|nr:uracil-DNA glycosylase [Bacteroidia bacterium]
MRSEVKIESSWKQALEAEFEKPYFHQLKEFLQLEKAAGKTIYPPGKQFFAAFDYTPFNQVKVVILGQDPYHGAGQAHGLCFSVNHGVAVPPSLQNIYKELSTDINGFSIPVHGNLTQWATQGILLLNATLSVEANKAGSHQGKGWEQFTDAAINKLSQHHSNLVFMLWGKFAQSKAPLIDHTKHLILTAAHPSPFSAYQGFMGCKHFSKANAYLIQQGQQAINWQV